MSMSSGKKVAQVKGHDIQESVKFCLPTDALTLLYKAGIWKEDRSVVYKYLNLSENLSKNFKAIILFNAFWLVFSNMRLLDVMLHNWIYG